MPEEKDRDRLSIRLTGYRDFIENYLQSDEYKALPLAKKIFRIFDDVIFERTIAGILNRHLNDVLYCETVDLTIARVHQIRRGNRPTTDELTELSLVLPYSFEQLLERRDREFNENGNGSSQADPGMPEDGGGGDSDLSSEDEGDGGSDQGESETHRHN